jgi:L-ascorbate metabolism protein UlaG (beta-lactamase superfamily)
VSKTMIRSLTAAAMLAVGLVSARAGDSEKMAGAKDQKAACTTACKKMLKGVVHFTDDDVRFARKGGGAVFVDPMSGPTAPDVVKSGLVNPDLILITHPHGDHFKPAVLQEYIQANPKVVLAGPAEVVKLAAEKGIAGMQVVEPNQTYTIAGFEFHTLPAYFEKKEAGHPRDHQWVGYVLSLNGARYYVTGDTQPLPEMAEAKADVIFPLLSGCGGNMDQALKMVSLSGARFVVPVHTSNQIETIKKYIARLPEGIQSAYYTGGQLNPPL